MPRNHRPTALSIKPELLKRAKAVAAEKGFENSFSAYVVSLIKADVESFEHSDQPLGKRYRRAA